MEGLKQLLETANIIRVHFHPCSVKILGLLLTFVENRIIFSRQIQQQMREYFGDLVFDTVIHRTVRLAEAPSAGESVLTYAPGSRGAVEYMALAEEVIEGRPSEKRTSDDETVVEEVSSGEAVAGEVDDGRPSEERTSDDETVAEEVSSGEAVAEGVDDGEPSAEEKSNGEDAAEETADGKLWMRR
jgi:hypothetical protein